MRHLALAILALGMLGGSCDIPPAVFFSFAQGIFGPIASALGSVLAGALTNVLSPALGLSNMALAW